MLEIMQQILIFSILVKQVQGYTQESIYQYMQVGLFFRLTQFLFILYVYLDM